MKLLYMSNLNTNIDDYDIDDLFKILGLRHEDTVENINKKLDDLISEKQLKPDIVIFLEKARYEIIKFITNNTLNDESSEDEDSVPKRNFEESETEGQSDEESEGQGDEESEGQSAQESDSEGQSLEESDSEGQSDVESESQGQSEEESDSGENGVRGQNINKTTDINNVGDIEQQYSKENDITINRADQNPFPTNNKVTQVISIDTRFRPNYQDTLSTSFTLELPEIQKNVTSMKIASIEMPMTYYSISTMLSNNTMLILGDISDNLQYTSYVTSDFTGIQSAWLVTIEDGRYDTSWTGTMETSKTAINDAMDAAIPGAVNENNMFSPFSDPSTNDYFDSSSNFFYSVDSINKKSVFTDQTNNNIVKQLRFNVDQSGNIDDKENIQTKLGWMLGFRNTEYTTSTDVNPITLVETITIKSEGVPFLSGMRYCFLALNDFKNMSLPSFVISYSDSVKSENIIARINLAMGGDMSVGGRDGGFTHNSTRSRVYQGPVDIQKIQVSLHDEYGRIIDLNNMDWSFTLAFEKNIK